MGRPREHDEATRERLLEAAERLSATKGFDGVTVRAVAAEADTSTRAVYALFASKQGLEQALHEAMFTRLRDLLQASPRTDDPRSDLLELSLAYRRWAVERPERYALAIHRFVGQHARPRSDEGLAVSRAALDELRQTVARLDEAGLIGDRDPEDAVVQLRAVVHGLAEFENIGLLGPDPEGQWRTVIVAVLDGYLQASAAAAA
ncbi:MAG TPA: TetR/AcrR family transcriptional regulator [Solirubrobacteraceae bacterium]